MTTRFLVTGGTGFVGTALCERLLAAGHPVTVLSRSPDEVAARFGGRAEATADLAALPAEPGHDVLVNLAGESINQRWSDAVKERLRRSRLETTGAVVDYARRAGAQAVISASAVGYYGDRGDEELDESSPPADDFLARLCVDWEAVTEPLEEAGIRRCLVRIGVVLDRGGGALDQMLTPFKLGVGGRLGSGRQWMSWIHRQDLVGLIEHLAGADAASGPYDATAPNPVTNREFTKTLGSVLGRPTVLPVPGFAVKLMMGEMGAVVLGGQKVLPRRTLEAGYTFAYPELRGALEAILG